MEVDDAAEKEGATARVEKTPKNCNNTKIQDLKMVISASELETIIEKHVSRKFGERYGMLSSLRKTTKQMWERLNWESTKI